MQTEQFSTACFNHPCFFPIAEGLSCFSDFDHWPTLADYNNYRRNKNIRFVGQQPKSKVFNEQYEPRIYLHGEVQTRINNWHDFFNMQVWQAFPQLKQQMNVWQYRCQLARLDKSPQRSNIENKLTLFDENGIIVVSSKPELLTLLRNHQWQELFCQQREEVRRSMRWFIVGHALYEKMLNPYLGMTGKGLLLNVDASWLQQPPLEQIAALDQQCTELMQQPEYFTRFKRWAAVPVLGIPDWYDANHSPDFYKDTNYFRPKFDQTKNFGHNDSLAKE